MWIQNNLITVLLIETHNILLNVETTLSYYAYYFVESQNLSHFDMIYYDYKKISMYNWWNSLSTLACTLYMALH